jgi:hypothetical protein
MSESNPDATPQVRSALEQLYDKALKKGHTLKPFAEWVSSGQYKLTIESLRNEDEPETLAEPEVQIITEQQLSAYTNIVPLEIHSTMEATWEPIKTALQLREPYILGMHMMIGGFSGTGKSHLAGTAKDWPGVKLHTGRIIPPGFPVYGIDFENKLRPVWEQNWSEDIGYKLLPANIYVEDPDTRQLDPVGMLYEANKLIYSLRNQTQGTLLIDTVSFYTDLMLYAFMRLEKHIKFSDFMSPDRKILPFEYQFKAKTMHELMRKLRNYKINVIYTFTMKDDWEALDPTKPAEQVKVGDVPNIQKNTDHWAEFVVQMKLVEDADGWDRIATVTKSNYERRRITKSRMNFKAPNYSEIVERFIGEFMGGMDTVTPLENSTENAEG